MVAIVCFHCNLFEHFQSATSSGAPWFCFLQIFLSQQGLPPWTEERTYCACFLLMSDCIHKCVKIEIHWSRMQISTISWRYKEIENVQTYWNKTCLTAALLYGHDCFIETHQLQMSLSDTFHLPTACKAFFKVTQNTIRLKLYQRNA